MGNIDLRSVVPHLSFVGPRARITSVACSPASESPALGRAQDLLRSRRGPGPGNTRQAPTNLTGLGGRRSLFERHFHAVRELPTAAQHQVHALEVEGDARQGRHLRVERDHELAVGVEYARHRQRR